MENLGLIVTIIVFLIAVLIHIFYKGGISQAWKDITNDKSGMMDWISAEIDENIPIKTGRLSDDVLPENTRTPARILRPDRNI